MLIGDGGLCENTLVSSLLRRGVDRIVLFQSTDTPLRAGWEPHRRPPTANDVDDELAAYFGVFVNNASHPGYTYRSNHFFEEAEFAPLVLALQASQRSGRGAVASAELTTVRNDCAGPPAPERPTSELRSDRWLLGVRARAGGRAEGAGDGGLPLASNGVGGRAA